MILLNFGHPLTEGHLQQLAELTGTKPDASELRACPVQFDHEIAFAGQVQDLLDGLGFSAEEWQTLPMLINPPAHSLIALTLLAELHGRMGYFPAVIRLKPTAGAIPPRFDVAEIINLQVVRDAARQRRV